MCARRFLLAITILTLLVVAGAFALFQWGGSALRHIYTPQGHYTAPPPNSGPDYSKLDSWIARPGVANEPARWLPQGVGAGAVGGAAVFYIHPTTYLKGDRWNAPLVDEGDTAVRTDLFVQSEASAFNRAGAIWAPRYRQATYGSFLLKSQDAEEALNLAYSDVSAAFDEFLRHVPKESPIILAGHSQGALHLMHLLRDRKDQLSGRLVAAYVVGWPIDTASDLPALGFPGCSSSTETGCILSWMSFGDPPNPSLILADWQKTKGLTGGERRREDILCVNPITGTVNGTAPPRANPGTLVPAGDFTSATLEPGAVGAHCEKGLLILDGNVPPLGPFVLPGNNYHVYDYALFWGAIRQDAERRLAAWRSR
jgi:pimeloyl-ACP methyl ester carboxylesterase